MNIDCETNKTNKSGVMHTNNKEETNNKSGVMVIKKSDNSVVELLKETFPDKLFNISNMEDVDFEKWKLIELKKFLTVTNKQTF